MEKKIYTHDLATLILEIFEDLLAEQEVTLTSPEDDDRDEDSAILFGSTYGDLLTDVEDLLADTLEQYGVPYVRDEYSGTIF